MRRSCVMFCFVLTLLSSRTAAQQMPATDSAALRREVEELNRGMEAAMNRGDALGAAAFYADDATVRTARNVVAHGRAAIDQYFTSFKAKSWKLDVLEVGGTREMAYEIGKSTLVHGEPERTSVVSFVVVWKRQADGRLRILLDYYH